MLGGRMPPLHALLPSLRNKPSPCPDPTFVGQCVAQLLRDFCPAKVLVSAHIQPNTQWWFGFEVLNFP